MKNYQNIENKKFESQKPKQPRPTVTEDHTYSYYSKLLKEPFDSITELKEAEEAYYAKLKAKEDAAAQKKADADKVEEAFKALNAARKAYKEGLTTLTEKYAADLKTLKDTFEADKKLINNALATAEDIYAKALKAFTDKYDNYHVTLRDGDFETTIASTKTVTKDTSKNTTPYTSIAELFDAIFNY